MPKSKIKKPKDIFNLSICALFFAALILPGCARHQQKAAAVQLNVHDVGKAKAVRTAHDVLAEMHFSIDKIDPDSGFIRTRPLSGAQFFEFWRSDNVGAENSLQANLHSIRRTVELNISQRAEETFIDCDVRLQRLSLPEREVTSSARAYEMFSRSGPALQTLQLNPEQEEKMAWIDLGNDIELEKEILKRINNRMNLTD